MAYTQTTWEVGDAITKERMTKIENGIAEAHSSNSTNASNIASLGDTVSTMSTDVSDAKSDIQALQTDVAQIGQSASQGTQAWTYVREAMQFDGDTVTKSLNARIGEDEGYISSLQTEVQAARRDKTDLVTKITDIDTRISGLAGSITTINNKFTDASMSSRYGQYNSIEDRLDADETRIYQNTTKLNSVEAEIVEARGVNGSLLKDRFETIEGKLDAANASTAKNQTYGSLDARLEDIESEIVTARGGQNNLDARIDGIDTSITNLSDNKVNKTDIANNLTTEISGKVLDASQGRELEQKKIDKADIYNDLDYTTGGKVLDARQGKALSDTIASMDTAYKAADTAMDGRLDVLEEQVFGEGSGVGSGTTIVERIEALESEVDMASNDGERRLDDIEERLDDIDNVSTGALKTITDSVTGVSGRVTTLEGTVNDASTGLAATKAIADAAKATADAAATATDVTALTGRVTTLEGKDTIVVDKPNSGSNYTEGVPNVSNPNTDADYLIQDDDNKYYYWRYFGQETGWQLVGGAGGGSGSSSGEFAATLASIANPNENTDYFVGNNTIGYTHYRYVPSQIENEEGTFVRILPKGLLINAGVTNTGGLEAYTVENGNDNVFSDFVAFKDVEANPVTENDVVVSTNLIFTDTSGQTHTVNVQGGGGGAGGSSYTMRLNNVLSSLKLTVPKKEGYNAVLRAKVVVKDAGVVDTEFDQSHTINAAVQYRQSTSDPWTNFTTLPIYNDTEFSVNVNSILSLGNKTYIRITATTTIDDEEKSSSLTYEVTQVEMSIAAVNFNQATVRTTNFNFSYRCIGSGLTKVVHFKIDGQDIAGSPVTTTLHNDIAQQTITLAGLQVGMHSFQVYFTVDGIESNILNYYIIYNNDSTRVEPIVALAAENNVITYGDDLKINYTVTTPGMETTDEVLLELYTLDGSTEVPIVSQLFENVMNETKQEWRPVDYPESGTAYVRATATHTISGTDYTNTATITITINELETDFVLEPAGTANLVYSYNAYGRTNNDAGKEVYHYDYTALGNQHIEWTGAFNGFNWSGNGYVDGNTLTISGGATHTVNVPIFQNAYNNISLEDSEGVQNITQHGRTVEIEYEVASATDLNDVIINYMSNITTTTENGVTQKGGVGFQVTPQSCYLLKSGSTVNTDSTGFILNESDIAAAYLTPGMRIHLAFVIEPWSDTLAYDRSYHQSVNIYVNGEFANACPYVQGTDSFASTATLSIGSSSCVIKLYQIKMYNRGLTHKEILQNYKMAPAATRDKLTRFEDNDILNADGYVDYEKARTKYTCLLLTGPEPVYTTTTGGETVLSNPTVSPYKGYPSPAGRKDKKTGEAVGKTESGVTLTKANPNTPQGYDVEFDLRSTIPTDQSIDVPAYIGARGAYASSNNVQGTSSQKYPVHNLKVYLAKWQNPKTEVTETEVEQGQEIPQDAETITRTYKQVPHESDEGYDLVEVEDGEDTTGLTTETKTFIVTSTTTPGEIKKVKYSLKGKDEHGDDIGYAESTLCWKADYMSTDHANTFNANIADGLFTDTLPGASWGAKHQNTVYGIRCLLFQKQGSQPYEFLGDGCLNNDKGNNKTYDLERDGDEDADTASQKWELTNNSDDLGYFKTDTVFKTVGTGANAHIQAKDAFESTYPDEGDLKDDGLEPNYNHLQILLTWLSKRANYWDETNPTTRAAKKQIFIDEFEDHFNLNHALTYYLFSEYIALCDNRVKNMFLRSDNVKSETVYKISDGLPIFEGNSNPNADFFKAIDAIDTGETQQVAVEDPETHEITYETQTVYRYELHNRDDIDWENSTFAVWAPVLYDLDSCFGVENVGYLRVRYDANWDYTWNNAPQFNGYESRLWLQFADCFDTEIKATALSLYNRADGLNYTNFYRQQITDNLKNISPALSNQDMLIKFDKPWSEGFINYSLAEPAMETPYYKYLQRGSRTAQKTSFMNMRSKLLSSKYGATEFTNDSIKFRTGVPVGQSNLTETKITIVANQVMYPGVAYGDNKEPTRATANGGKVNAGQSCDIFATSPVQGNDGIFICGASVLTDIGDLSAFRPYQIDVGAGVNLKRLIVGSNASGYTNGNTDSFQNLNKCVLLEEVNIQNCSNVSTLDLSNNPLIKKVYAAGSGATTVIFPNGGVLNTVEYSAVTGNITILNQSNLQNFSYENSENNHYASLAKLWIENTPNVPIVSIINSSIAHLTAGIRLVGLDIDLVDDPTFLETITSDLAKGKYLDSAGAFTAGNTQYPYISGRVHINSIRASLLAKVNTIYPNLVVYNTIDGSGNPSNNVVPEYEVQYQNYDGTLLFTDYRTNEEHYIDPAYDTNPITNTYYISMPTKPEDAQYKYKFGTYDNQNRYRRYSGWVKRGTTTNPTSSQYVNSNTVFVAVYPTTEVQVYKVAWYDEVGGSKINEVSAEYGDDFSGEQSPIESGLLPKIKSTGNAVKVFSGWNRPLGKITGNVNVYGQWQSSTINDDTPSINLADLTAADLYALSLVGNDVKKTLLQDKLGEVIEVQMGQDFNYTEGVTTTNLLGSANELFFDGTSEGVRVYNSIKPLASNQDWTLAIDYKFLLNSQRIDFNSNEYVLASCYQNANSSIVGFKLSMIRDTSEAEHHQIQVSWGTETQIIDYAVTDSTATDDKTYFRSYRNMVVLSHNTSQPNVLRISYVAPNFSNNYANQDMNYASNYGTVITNTELTWESNVAIDVPLILGGNYSGTTTTIEENGNYRVPAEAVIYWAKYWDTDLGQNNCSELAAWPHEKVSFYLNGYNGASDAKTTEQVYTGSELSFVAAQGIGDRYFFSPRTVTDGDDDGYFGWHISQARTLCNDIIYNGLPQVYRSIIRQNTITSYAINTSRTLAPKETQDYMFLSAVREVNPNARSTDGQGREVNPSWTSPWSWMVPANKTNVLGFVSGRTDYVETKTVSDVKPYLYRFLGCYIKDTAKIYSTGATDPSSINNLRYRYANGTTERIYVQSGDVWVNGSGQAYMYFTNEEIQYGIIIDIPTTDGGWKKASLWNLRSYNSGSQGLSENAFIRIDDTGYLNTAPGYNQQFTDGRVVCPEFTV